MRGWGIEIKNILATNICKLSASDHFEKIFFKTYTAVIALFTTIVILAVIDVEPRLR